MNRNEINFLRDTLPPIHQFDSWSEDQKRLDEELMCREMIDSCLIYGVDFFNSKYKNDYTKELGEKRLSEIYNEQLKHFEKCEVLYNSYRDSEGVYYNSLIEPQTDNCIQCEIIENPVLDKKEDTNESILSIKVRDKYNNRFNIVLPTNVDNDYRKYYKGRKLKIEFDNSYLANIKNIIFLNNENSYEI